MKSLVILVLTLGIVGVIANPVSKQTIQSENKTSVQVESSDSQKKHGEVVNMSNKGDPEQKKDTPIDKLGQPNIIDTDGTVDIISEDNIGNQVDPVTDVKCEHDQNKNTPDENPEKPIVADKDVGQVEIIIEENLISSIDDNPQMQEEFASGQPLPGFIEQAPQLPEATNSPSPELPGFIGDSLHLPGFIEGPQVTEFVGGLQFPGFIGEGPQLPSFIGDTPQLQGFIQDGHRFTETNDDVQSDDDDNNIIDEDYFREDMEKIEHEIMETAAGFIPTPLVFRRKQKPRRRFVTRRHFRRNPYRRHQFFYPYNYYSYYRPSSLRYY